MTPGFLGVLFYFKIHMLHSSLSAHSDRTDSRCHLGDFPALWPWIKPALNTMRSNHPAGHDLDLCILVKEKTLFSTTKSHFASAAPSAASTALPSPFTLHFTADIISQISAHLVRILTDFDGSGEESHPSCCKLPFYRNTFWLIITALVLYSHVPINHCECDAGLTQTRTITHANLNSKDWCVANIKKNNNGINENAAELLYLNLNFQNMACNSTNKKTVNSGFLCLIRINTFQ